MEGKPIHQQTGASLARLPALCALGLMLFLWLVVVPLGPSMGEERQSLLRWLFLFWSEPQWQHALLAIPISVWLAYRLLPRIRIERQLLSNVLGLALMVAGLFLIFAGYRLFLSIVTLLGIQILLGGIVLFLMGSKSLRTWAEPLLIIGFAWPLPFLEAELGFHLRHISCKLSWGLLHLWPSLEVAREGTLLWFSDSAGERLALSVEGPCSGLKGLFSLTMAAAIYAHLRLRKMHSKIALILCAPVIAILSNVLRLALLTIASRLWGMEFAIGKNGGTSSYHMGVGIFTIGCGLLMIMLLARLIGRHQATPTTPKKSKTNTQLAGGLKSWFPALVPAALSLPLLLLCSNDSQLSLGSRPELFPLPATIGNLSGEKGEIHYNETIDLPPDVSIDRMHYVGGELQEGNQFTASVIQSGEDRRAIHRPEICLSSQGFEILKMEEKTIPLATGGATIPIRHLHLEHIKEDGSRQPAHYYYWFEGKGTRTTSHYQRIIISSRDALFLGQNYQWAAINFTAFETEEFSGEEISQAMETAIAEIAPAIGAGLPSPLVSER